METITKDCRIRISRFDPFKQVATGLQHIPTNEDPNTVYHNLTPSATAAKQKLIAEQIETESEKLFLEQAQAYFLELRQVAENAPKKILRHAEMLAFQKGREGACMNL